MNIFIETYLSNLDKLLRAQLEGLCVQAPGSLSKCASIV